MTEKIAHYAQIVALKPRKRKYQVFETRISEHCHQEAARAIRDLIDELRLRDPQSPTIASYQVSELSNDIVMRHIFPCKQTQLNKESIL